MNENNPEISLSIKTGSFNTNYHDYGQGFPLLMLHGSGPGVSAWTNWGRLFPSLSQHCRILAPDLAGFGFTERPAGFVYGQDIWLKQILNFLDALGLEKVDLLGYSFGGALALALAVNYPARVRRLVLMGSMGVSFQLTYGLDKVWGYTPSVEKMRQVLEQLVYSKELITDEMTLARYQACLCPGVLESFGAIFPAPRQRWVNESAGYEDRIKDIEQPALIIHGRDDRVIPLETSFRLHRLIENSQLHVFGRCGHWVQFEQTAGFLAVLKNFLSA